MHLNIQIVSLESISSPKERFELKEERLKTQNAIRTTLIQAVGGILLVLGAVTAWRQLQIGQQQLGINQKQLIDTSRLTREQLLVTSQGQLADRLARAEENLGSTSTDVRIGAIYTLETIYTSSPNEHSAIRELLTEYVRARAPRPVATSEDNVLFRDDPEDVGKSIPYLAASAPDIQAALTVLGRTAIPKDHHSPIFLIGLTLRFANFSQMNFSRVIFAGSDLQQAYLIGTDLQSAHLNNVILYDAELNGANLSGADLSGANLRKADLSDAIGLMHATLQGAKADAETLWPEGFDPIASGVMMVTDTSASNKGEET